VEAVTTALRALLHGVVDYAGLYPPAALDMATAVREYDHYRTSPDAWMLGRFIVSIGRLDEFAAALRELHPTGPAEWPIAALYGADIAADVRRAQEFNDAGAGARIDTLEGRATSDDEIIAAAAHAAEAFTVFVEFPLRDDPAPFVETARRSGVNAKMRTGGVTADAFPPATEVVRFMRRCVDAGVLFKATAGLHHPIRAQYRLTYAEDAPRGMMYGYLNVFMAAALIANGASDDDARSVLEEREANAFEIFDEAFAWRGFRLDAAALKTTRHCVISSFGSCSFREPVDDLQSLGFLP